MYTISAEEGAPAPTEPPYLLVYRFNLPEGDRSDPENADLVWHRDA